MSKHTFHIQNPSIYLYQLDLLHTYESCVNVNGHLSNSFSTKYGVWQGDTLWIIYK